MNICGSSRYIFITIAEVHTTKYAVMHKNKSAGMQSFKHIGVNI